VDYGVLIMYYLYVEHRGHPSPSISLDGYTFTPFRSWRRGLYEWEIDNYGGMSCGTTNWNEYMQVPLVF